MDYGFLITVSHHRSYSATLDPKKLGVLNVQTKSFKIIKIDESSETIVIS